MAEAEDRIRQIRDIFSMSHFQGEIAAISEVFLLPEHTACPCCTALYSDRKIVGTAQQAPPVHWVECRSCGAWSVSRMPDQHFLNEAYKLAHSIHPVDESFNDYRRLARHIIQKARLQGHKGPLNILDYGSGNGSLLKAMRSILGEGQISYTGVDLMNGDDPIAVGGISLYGYLPGGENKYSLIIASAVMEHIPDAHGVLTTLYQMLDEKGVMYIRTPWHGPFKLILKGMDMGFPGHVHDMGRPFWENIWDKTGCPADILHSAPSINQTGYRYHFWRTLFADIMKMPANIINLFRSYGKPVIWPYVGGWEIVVRKRSSATSR